MLYVDLRSHININNSFIFTLLDIATYRYVDYFIGTGLKTISTVD